MQEALSTGRDANHRQALQASEARTRAILDAAVDAIITIDERGVIESINPATERLFGYSAAELVGENVKLLMPPPFRDEHAVYLQNYLRTGNRRIIGIGREVVGRRKDGTTFPMHLAVSELWLGERRMFTGIARDITDLHKAIAGLQESEARHRAILEAAADAVITIDEGGRIESVNPAAEQMFGFAAAELIGQNIKLLMPAPYRDEHDGYLAHYLATGERKIIGIGREVVGRRKNGTTFPVDLSVSEVHLGDRRLFTGMVRDLSERVQSADQLRTAAAVLRQRNAELVRSNQELDDFAYIASHDLKEPLRGIHNYATFLMEDYGDKLDEAGRTKLATLQRLSERMDGLISALLQTARLGREEMAIQNTCLDALLAEVLDSLRANLEEHRVEIRIPRPLPSIDCDRVRVGEVFHNLISNAIKYNDKPVRWIEIGAVDGAEPSVHGGEEPRTGGASGLTFYVRDNGIGIRENHCDSIFRIFKRLHGRDEFGGGSGVGLTIVKKGVERHGGRVWVESKYGEGSTFFFTLSGDVKHDFGKPTDPAG